MANAGLPKLQLFERLLITFYLVFIDIPLLAENVERI